MLEFQLRISDRVANLNTLLGFQGEPILQRLIEVGRFGQKHSVNRSNTEFYSVKCIEKESPLNFLVFNGQVSDRNKGLQKYVFF